MSWLARLLAGIFYRLHIHGGELSRSGPVLVVANHPNSLLDPVLVMAAAQRPVRFLAKAPLFVDPLTRWFVRIGGAIPVHRRQDAVTGVVENATMFASVHDALVSGEVVGLFPEGISHSEASLAPLKTGAARIALGAAEGIGRAIPIVPIGLVFQAKDRFRSRAMVVRGEPVAWDDLSASGSEDAEAVRRLTERIEAALRRQTLNLTSWHDRPAVELAVRIWESSQAERPSRDERVGRLAEAARVLAKARELGDPLVAPLANDLRAHASRLARLRVRPGDLVHEVTGWSGVAWVVRTLPILLPMWAAIGVVGWLAFLVPYRVTGAVVGRLRLADDVRSTWKALLGAAIYLVWMVVVVALVWYRFGWLAASGVLVGLPVVGMAGLVVRERWAGAWHDARRFLLFRSRRSLIESLAARQRALAGRLETLLNHYTDLEAS